MKKALIFVGALAVLSVMALAGIAFFIFSQKEDEKNKLKTAPARAARWAAKDDEIETAAGDDKTNFEKLDLKELKDEKS